MSRYSNIQGVLTDLESLASADRQCPTSGRSYTPSVAGAERNLQVTLSFLECTSNEDALEILAAAARAQRRTGVRVYLDFSGCRFGY